ncbi:MAG: carbonic anhydrase [Acetobacteraceae bacterium]
MSGDTALRRLIEGNARYRANQTHMRDYGADRAKRVGLHRPLAVLLSCADARVGPEFLFDTGPGDLFVVRVAGNIADDDGLASMEYAVRFLGAPLVFVLGHSQCGAVDAAIKVMNENAVLPGLLPGLIAKIKPAVATAQASRPASLLDAAIAENVRQSMRKINETRPILSEGIAGGSQAQRRRLRHRHRCGDHDLAAVAREVVPIRC